MAYKVKYTTFAILADGRIGNIPQGQKIIYTDYDTSIIKTKIDERYAKTGAQLVAVIDIIERVPGLCLPVEI